MKFAHAVKRQSRNLLKRIRTSLHRIQMDMDCGYGNQRLRLQCLSPWRKTIYFVYCDAGVFLNRHGVLRFAEYLQFLKEESTSVVAFSLNGDFKASNLRVP
jgi:hypothetical protein